MGIGALALGAVAALTASSVMNYNAQKKQAEAQQRAMEEQRKASEQQMALQRESMQEQKALQEQANNRARASTANAAAAINKTPRTYNESNLTTALGVPTSSLQLGGTSSLLGGTKRNGSA